MSVKIGATESIALQKKEFQKIYSREFLANFDHAPVVSGDGVAAKMDQVRESLNQFAESLNLQVRFDRSIPLGFLVGGSCSAISLRVAEKGLEVLSTSKEEKEIKSYVEKFRRELNKKREFKRELRGEQIACNTMVVAEEVNPLTIERDKVAALAGLKELYLEPNSIQFEIKEGVSQEMIYASIAKLDPGVYVIRLNLPTENHKLEVRGHTATLIVFDEETRLLFDPNFGLFQLDLGSDLFFQMLNSTFSHFGVCAYGLYKLSREHTDPIVKISLSGLFRKCRETYITRVSINALKLNGFLARPYSVKGVVVFLPGSGIKAENPSYFSMASHLNGLGFATLAVDLVLESERKQEFQEGGVPRLVNESSYLNELTYRVHSAVDYACKTFPHLPLGIIGVSTGAALAIGEAASNHKIRAIVSRGGRPDVAPRGAISKIENPVLFLAGTKDPEVLNASREAYKTMKNKDVKLIEIEGADHGFRGEGHLQAAMEHTSTFLIEKLFKV